MRMASTGWGERSDAQHAHVAERAYERPREAVDLQPHSRQKIFHHGFFGRAVSGDAPPSSPCVTSTLPSAPYSSPSSPSTRAPSAWAIPNIFARISLSGFLATMPPEAG